MLPAEAKAILAQAKQGVLNEAALAPQRLPVWRAPYRALANARARGMVMHALATHAAANGGSVTVGEAARILLTASTLAKLNIDAPAVVQTTGDPDNDVAIASARAVDATDTFDNQVIALGQIVATHIGKFGRVTAPQAQALIDALIAAANSAQAQQAK